MFACKLFFIPSLPEASCYDIAARAGSSLDDAILLIEAAGSSLDATTLLIEAGSSRDLTTLLLEVGSSQGSMTSVPK